MKKFAITIFLISLLWPSLDSETYVPSVVLFFKAIGALPFAGVGFLRGEFIEPTLRVGRLLLGAILPNILMGIFLFMYFEKRRLPGWSWLVYLANFIFMLTFISLPFALDYIDRLSEISLLLLLKLGGLVLWTLALLFMAISLWFDSKLGYESKH